MAYMDIEICTKVLDALKNDSILTSYVKSFTLGEMNVARTLFPFINVGNTHISVESINNVDDMKQYTIVVSGGMHSHVGNVAYAGDGSGKKGIVELCSDITAVIRQNTFDGVFSMPVRKVIVDTEALCDKAGFIRICAVKFKGVLIVRNN
jgi:hypothetical protein